MYLELTKSQKKIAPQDMGKGLENHYSRALGDIDMIIHKWQKGLFKDTRETCMDLFVKLKFQKHSALKFVS